MNSIISKDLIVLDMEAESKKQVIKELSKLLNRQGCLVDYDGYVEEVFKRETDPGTSAVYDIAVPHGRCAAVKSTAVAFARLTHQIKWNEKQNAKYIFLIAAPISGAGDTELRILTGLARRIMRQEFRDRLMKSEGTDEVLMVLNEL